MSTRITSNCGFCQADIVGVKDDAGEITPYEIVEASVFDQKTQHANALTKQPKGKLLVVPHLPRCQFLTAQSKKVKELMTANAELSKKVEWYESGGATPAQEEEMARCPDCGMERRHDEARGWVCPQCDAAHPPASKAAPCPNGVCEHPESEHEHGVCTHEECACF
ncbi:MAG TPA: hypothetical protein VM285_01360 [Polyangia bacterium]|nr:hypothetical protein [Polyangia bacterium]